MHEALVAGSVGGPATGPKVSIIVVNRDGESRLRRLIAALATTDYAPLELIVVDTGSKDGSISCLEGAAPGLPLTIIRSGSDQSFSEANAQAVGASDGELLLLLDSEVESLISGWLGRMVETLVRRQAVAVGARLVRPRRRQRLASGAEAAGPDLTLHHRGVGFGMAKDGAPESRNLGAGEDPLGQGAADFREVPAVSAECMLVRRDAYEAAGGLDAGYNGSEDVDLCLKLRAKGGTIVYDGLAVLYRHEVGVRSRTRSRIKASDRLANRRLFLDRWGPQLFRTVLLDRLRGAGEWSEDPLRIGITLTQDDPAKGYGDYSTAHEIGDALRALGFEISYWERHRDRWRYIDPTVDVVIALIDSFPVHSAPDGAILVAWVRNWTERWIEQPGFDDYDIVVASSTRSKEIIEQRSSQIAQVLPLATNPVRFRPRGVDPELRCDLNFVGNYWERPRAVIEALPKLADVFDVKVFGKGWEGIEGMFPLTRGSLAYGDLARAYSSAELVVDDAAGHTKPFNSVNARVFDALACGTLVVSNCVDGVRELFGEDFPTWQDAESLRNLVAGLRADPARANALAERYRAEVLENHTYARRAAQIRDLLTAWCESTRVSIAAGVPHRQEAESWGDFHFARGLQRELRAQGHPASVELLPDWERASGARPDVRLHLFGLSKLSPRSGQVNLLWVISHPELVDQSMIDSYDAAFAASRSFAEQLGNRCETSVTPLMQATDPRRFYPDPQGPKHRLLFVGNSRRVRRRIVDDVTRSGHEIALYGREWTTDLADPKLVHGELIDNRELRRWYSSALIVLNDHWDGMQAEGFLSNRLYDALACGACVLSDHVVGIEAEFDQAVVTYRDENELPQLLDQLLGDAALRQRLGATGREAVLARHTFVHRTAELLDAVAPLLADVAAVIGSRAPSPSREKETGAHIPVQQLRAGERA